jgi:hypothetical protein
MLIGVPDNVGGVQRPAARPSHRTSPWRAVWHEVSELNDPTPDPECSQQARTDNFPFRRRNAASCDTLEPRWGISGVNWVDRVMVGVSERLTLRSSSFSSKIRPALRTSVSATSEP